MAKQKKRSKDQRNADPGIFEDSYTHHTYECEEFVDGLQIADKLSLPYEQVYKTLVTVSNSKNYFLYSLNPPIAAELDLKKAAKIGRGKERGNDPRKDMLTPLPVISAAAVLPLA